MYITECSLEESGKITNKADAAASFQEAVVDVLVFKTIAAGREYGVNQIILAGGVAANRHLRERLVGESPLPVIIPEFRLCTDNAAMIALRGKQLFRKGITHMLNVSPYPSIPGNHFLKLQ